MILRDAYDNIVLFGAEIRGDLITANLGWVSSSASSKVKLFDPFEPNKTYLVSLKSLNNVRVSRIVNYIKLLVIEQNVI